MIPLSRSLLAGALSLALGALVAAPGCKKDEPAAPAPAATTAEPAKADGPVKAAEAVADKAAEAAGAAADKAAADKAAADKAAEAAAAVVAAPSLVLPEGVLMAAGVPSLSAVLTTVSTVANKIAPGQIPPDLASMALEGMKSLYGFTDITWLDQTAPMKFANVDPKTHDGKGQAILIPITDKDKVLASLPADAKKELEGHAASFESQGQTWYLDFVEGHAVLTDHPGVFAERRDFISGPLAAWKPERLFTTRINMTTVNTAFAKELQDARAAAEQLTSQAAQEPGMPDASKVMKKYTDLLFEVVDSTTAAQLDLYVQDGSIRFGASVDAKDGSGLANFARLITGKSSSLADVAPATTWLGFTGNMDVREIKSIRDMQKLALETYAGLLKLTPEESAKIDSLFDRMAAQSTGESATAFAIDGTFPFALTTLSKVTDATQLRGAYGELLDLVFLKAWGYALAEMKKDGKEVPGAADVKDLPGLIRLLGGIAEGMGVKLTLVSEVRGDVQVDALTVDADLEKLGLNEKDPAAFAIVDGLIGRHLELAFGFKNDALSMGFGPHGIQQALDLASGKRPGGEPTLTAAARGNAMAGTLRIDVILNALTAIPEVARMKEAIDKLPKGEAFTMTAAGSGNTSGITLAFPIETIAALVGLAR